MHSDAKFLKEQGDLLFSQKRVLDTRNQEIADNFYPERADFTVNRSIGADFAEHLLTGYPSMVRRDLANSLGTMLRPKAQQWFHMKGGRHERVDHEGKAWLEDKSKVLRRAMYDRKAMFNRATSEGDNDFASFGSAVISVEANRRDTAMLYRTWHLRDTAWSENSYGQIGQIHRNWEPTARELCQLFQNPHPKVLEIKEKEPSRKVKCRHIMVENTDYKDGTSFEQPWVSIFMDIEHQHMMEEVGNWTRRYVIPRWATIAGSQYAFSPAALIALPDARLAQAMSLTLLEAGEKATDPPLIGVAEAIKGDVQLYAGGFTAIDAEYDERMGDVLKPLDLGKAGGIPYGSELLDRRFEMIAEAFYLNRLALPASEREMTAFETGQRVQEYIRQALPLFEPMEQEYNFELCDMTTTTLLHEGAFGPISEIPESLGTELSFDFENPLAELIDRQKGQKFLESKAMLAEAAAIDPTTVDIMDFKETLRDVLEGIGTPVKWLNSPEEVEAMAEAREQQREAQELLATMQQGADVAETLSNASQGFEQ